MPHDWVEIVKADPAADYRNISVEWKDKVVSEFAPGRAHIPDNTDQAASRNKNTEYMPPHLFQLAKEDFVFLDVPKLTGAFVIAFQIPASNPILLKYFYFPLVSHL